MTKEASGLPDGPWCQDARNPKHVYNSRDEIVALTVRPAVARRLVASVNAVASLGIEVLEAGVIEEAREELIGLFQRRLSKRPG